MGTILWDFDGTLATRPGLWSQAMVDVLDRESPGHGFTRDHFRPALRNGFPWDRHEEAHFHLNRPNAWWDEINRLISTAFASVGLDAHAVASHTSGFRDVFLDPRAWIVYDDTVESLNTLSAIGWWHVIVSNHVPELPRLVDELGLADHFHDIVTSALVGYEKPHPGIFRLATERLAGPVVMVGDNPVADVGGARSAGITAFLVRRQHDEHDHHPDLHALVPNLRRLVEDIR